MNTFERMIKDKLMNDLNIEAGKLINYASNTGKLHPILANMNQVAYAKKVEEFRQSTNMNEFTNIAVEIMESLGKDFSR